MIPRTFPTNADGEWVIFDIDATGLTAWVHYIPVEDVTGTGSSRYDDAAGMVVDSLADATGLVAWVDYTPVNITTGANWRSDDGGTIPVIIP